MGGYCAALRYAALLEHAGRVTAAQPSQGLGTGLDDVLMCRSVAWHSMRKDAAGA